jgi:dihydroorotase
MKILIKSAEILDHSSPYHGQVKNVLVENGLIHSISDQLHDADEVIEAGGMHLSVGFMDMRASFRDPGFEFKEDIATGSLGAAYGGFTEVALLPNTQPQIQNKDIIAYLKMRSDAHLVQLYPMANLTVDAKGEEMTEMLDLHYAGAVAFTDGNKPVWNTGVMVKALQYLQPFNGLLVNHAEELELTKYGQMNEGKMSTYLGLKGIPKLAEELMIARDIELLRYAGGKIHFSRVSSPKSLELIKAGRKSGLNITCDVAVHQLVFTDKDLTTFDTNLKVNPPLRSKDTVQQLWKALSEGVIDAIVTDHTPQDEESKKLEFDQAAFGMLGLETAFAVLNTSGKLELGKLIAKFTTSPREILQIDQPQILEGNKANLTLLDVHHEWRYEASMIKSKSRNTPFVGRNLKGRVKAVFNKGKHLICY